MPNGSKLWRYKYRFIKKEKVLSLGVYPEVSLKEAREKHFRAHKQVSEGRYPSSEKREFRQSQFENAANTFEVSARAWMKHNETTWSANHATTVRRRMEQDVFPLIGQSPIRGITPKQLLNVICKIEERSAYEMARRALQMSGKVFRFAIIHDLADRDPSQDLKGALALRPYKKSHYAAMDFPELPNFLEKFDWNEARVFPNTRYAIELLMLTFVRTSELIKAQWEEFDLERSLCIIPAHRMKMRKEHIVPLSSS